MDFPYAEIRKKCGNYFGSQTEAMQVTGLDEDHIWSVAICDETDTYTYGPCHHFINVLGYIATKEAHDNNTYYEEEL